MQEYVILNPKGEESGFALSTAASILPEKTFLSEDRNLAQIPAGRQRARNVRLLAGSASSHWSSE